MDYVLGVLILLLIYVILTVTANLIVGYAGLFSVAHAAVFGIGAYVTTILMVDHGLNFFLTVPFAVAMASVTGSLIAIPAVRLVGFYLAIASFGLQFVIMSLMLNLKGFTRGADGIPGIPNASLFGFKFGSRESMLILVAVLAAITVILLWRLVNSPFGRVLRAVRDDEIAAAAMGKPVVRYKVLAYSIGSGLAALAGSAYAAYYRYVDPSAFDVKESIFILSMVVIGGSGSIRGSLAGATVLVLTPEVLRMAHLPNSITSSVRQIISGLLLTVFMLWRPQGLIPEHSRRRKQTEAIPVAETTVASSSGPLPNLPDSAHGDGREDG